MHDCISMFLWNYDEYQPGCVMQKVINSLTFRIFLRANLLKNTGSLHYKSYTNVIEINIDQYLTFDKYNFWQQILLI